MSNNPHNQQPARPIADEPTIDSVASSQGDFKKPARATQSTQSEAPLPTAADAPQEPKAEAEEPALSSSEADGLSAGSNEARHLMVVPGNKPGQAAPPLTPAAKQAQRQAWLAARAARAARAATARDNPLVPVKPTPVRERTAPLEAWPALANSDEILSSLRKNRQRRFFTRLALFVGVPTLLIALYVFAWATPRYQSEFEITYQTYQNTQSLSSGLIQSVLGGGSNSIDPGSILLEYIRSETLLQKLDQKLDLRKYYSSGAIDYPVRMSSKVSDEAFLRYYRNHIVSASEGLGGYLTVDVQAFDPKFAHTLALAIVEACDQMVDDMTARAREDGMRFAESEVTRQEERVQRAKVADAKFQNEHHDLNPTNTATQYGQIIGNLETQLSQARTALTNTLSYAKPDAPQVTQLKNQIAALEAQLHDQRSRLTGSGATYSQILEEYSRLQLEDQFAQNAYQSAQQGLAVARADASRKQSYLVDFVAPSNPDGPTQIFYITYLAAGFLGSLFLYAIGNLIVGAFRDQAGL